MTPPKTEDWAKRYLRSLGTAAITSRLNIVDAKERERHTSACKSSRRNRIGHVCESDPLQLTGVEFGDAARMS